MCLNFQLKTQGVSLVLLLADFDASAMASKRPVCIAAVLTFPCTWLEGELQEEPRLSMLKAKLGTYCPRYESLFG